MFPASGATVETLAPGTQEACKVLTCDAKEVNEQALTSRSLQAKQLEGWWFDDSNHGDLEYCVSWDSLELSICVWSRMSITSMLPEHRLLILINKKHTFLIDIEFYCFYWKNKNNIFESHMFFLQHFLVAKVVWSYWFSNCFFIDFCGVQDLIKFDHFFWNT